MNTFSVFDEKELVTRLREGDKVAFERLYAQYKTRLAGNFIKLLRDDELAKDAMQELSLKLWNARESIDVDQSFKAYLFRIAENLVFDYYKKMARDRAKETSLLSELEDWYSHIEEDLISKENISQVRAIIDKLPEKQRKAYVLHKMEGKSYKEIAEIMDIAPSTINKHIYTAHKFVKEQIIASAHFRKVILITLFMSWL